MVISKVFFQKNFTAILNSILRTGASKKLWGNFFELASFRVITVYDVKYKSNSLKKGLKTGFFKIIYEQHHRRSYGNHTNIADANLSLELSKISLIL